MAEPVVTLPPQEAPALPAAGLLFWNQPIAFGFSRQVRASMPLPREPPSRGA